MNNLKIENHLLRSADSLPDHLANDILSNTSLGRAAVVTQSPRTLMKSVENEFRKEKIHLSLSAIPPNDFLEAQITFATGEAFIAAPPICRVIYITYPIERHKFHMLTSWMPKHSLVVIYV